MADYFGQDEYSILNSKHFIGIHGYMLVYSVGSKQSFEMVRIIRDKILNHLVYFLEMNLTIITMFADRPLGIRACTYGDCWQQK